MTAPRVLVVGDIFLDVLVGLDADARTRAGTGPAPRTCSADGPETEIFHARWHRVVLGGSAARTAQTLAAFGCQVELLACVGADPLGNALTATLAASGVGIGALIRVDGTTTGVTTVMTTTDGNSAITVARGANDAIAASHLPDVIESDWVHVSGYLLRTAAGRELARLLAKRVPAFGIPLSLDPGAPGDVAIAATVAELLPTVAWLTPNLAEAIWLSSRDTAAEAATALHSRGAGRVAVTCGCDGAVITDATGTVTVAAPRIAHGETTGPGDAFGGGLIAATLGGLDSAAAAVVACACGAQVAAGQRPGPGRAIEELMRQTTDTHRPAHERALAWVAGFRP